MSNPQSKMQFVCPSCGFNPHADPNHDPDEDDYDEDEGYNNIIQFGIQKSTSNSVGMELHKCGQCGYEMATVECPECYHSQLEKAVFDPWTNKFSWDTTCQSCNHSYEAEYQGKVSQQVIDQINQTTKSSTGTSQTTAVNTAPPQQMLSNALHSMGARPHNFGGQPVQPTTSPTGPGGTQKKGGIKGMNSIHVQNVQATIPEQAFRDACNQAFGGAQNYTLTNQRTKSGKDVLQLEPKTGGKLLCFLDAITKEVKIEPYKFSSVSWLAPTLPLFELLKSLAKASQGIFEGYEENQGPILIHGGQSQNAEFYIVKKGTTPNFAEDEAGDMVTAEFRIIKPLKEFLQETPDLQAELSKHAFPDNINVVGKALIQMKKEDKLSFDIFRNLLIQLVILGANDPSVKAMYDFIK